MIEKLKSAVLVMLVVLSLVQTYLLSYSHPKPDPVMPGEYVKTDRLGAQMTLDDMLFPDQLIVHLGNQQHTVLYPKTEAYNTIFNTMRKRGLEGFRKTTTAALGINWDEVQNKQIGVEIRFREGLPMNVLNRIMQLRGDMSIDSDLITRIWIYAVNPVQVRVILFTDTANTVYEAVTADITAKDIEERFTGPLIAGGYMPYKHMPGDYYLPTRPLRMLRYEMGYTRLTVDQLKRTFFVDPGVIRNITERDGAEIYTDSKRGLKLRYGQLWMAYSDPVASADNGRSTLSDNLAAAVKFINQYGGWNGTYSLQKVPQRLLLTNQPFVFRQYYDSFPIINPHEENVGFMKIVVQKEAVSAYERSLISPDTRKVNGQETELVGGEALDVKLEQYKKKAQIVTVFPAYRQVTTEQQMQLIPAWAAELRDGTYEFIE